jgi:hypothetical protein
MDFPQALAQLREWCDRSAGNPIELASGRSAIFHSRPIHDAGSLREVEDLLGCSLPESYFQFMSVIGASSLFSWLPYGGGLQLYAAEEVIAATLAVIASESNEAMTDRFCFVGEHRSMGDLMGFAVSRAGPRNFDVFCHEYPLEEYVATSDKLKSWRTFDEWLIHAVDTLGENSL